MSRMDLVREATDLLIAGGVSASARIAQWLVCASLNCSLAHLVAFADRPVSSKVIHTVLLAAQRCVNREPLQYVTGYTHFHHLKLKVTPAVMIPRPETEQLVKLVLGHMVAVQYPAVLDIGTGSGCIALAIKHERRDARIIGCDLSRSALEIAACNAASNVLDVTLVQADMMDSEFLHQIGRQNFDVVVSNPPYIPDIERPLLEPEVRDHEPALALYCGVDPLRYYRAIVTVIEAGALRTGGLLALEAHADYACAVARLMESAGFTAVKIRRDYAGFNRFVIARWNGTSGSGDG